HAPITVCDFLALAPGGRAVERQITCNANFVAGDCVAVRLRLNADVYQSCSLWRMGRASGFPNDRLHDAQAATRYLGSIRVCLPCVWCTCVALPSQPGSCRR